MSWNYRIIKYADGSGYGLHEVYYDDRGKPMNMTEDPATFMCDEWEGPEGIIGSLMMARTDAHKRPMLDEAATWPTQKESPTP